MIPPNLPGPDDITCTTASGITYIVLSDEYAEHWAADVNMVQANVVIDWADRDEFVLDAVGWAQWDGVSPTLNRNRPMACPIAPGLWCDDCVLTDKGMVQGSGTPTYDVNNGNWPYFDYGVYKLTFIRPKWWLRDDYTLSEEFSGQEQFRFTEITPRYIPRMRKKPGQSLIYDVSAAVTSEDIVSGTAGPPWPSGPTWASGDTLEPVSEVGFAAPDNNIEYLCKWKSVPANAIPWIAIDAALNHVNSEVYSIGVCPCDSYYSPSTIFDCPIGTLLFSGLAAPISFYFDATGNQVADIIYTFTYQRGGWNYYRIALQSAGRYLYAPLAARNGSGLIEPPIPPFPSYTFQKLFTPAAA